jgi:hypothetical protein
MSRLSSTALRKLEGLEEARRKWDHVRSMVEQAAGHKADMALLQRIGRTAADVGRVLDEAGYGAMSQSVAQLGMIVRRTTTSQSKIGTMRELVAAVRTGIDQAERNLEKEAQQVQLERQAQQEQQAQQGQQGRKKPG